MKLVLSIIVWLGLLATCGGCVSDVANRYYLKESLPEKAIDDVAVLWDSPTDRKYEVIADFQSRGESARDMQKKAAKVGADAVIVQLLGGEWDTANEWAGQDARRTYSRIAATAIRWR